MLIDKKVLEKMKSADNKPMVKIINSFTKDDRHISLGVCVMNPDGSKRKNVGALVDTGATRSVVSYPLAAELGLSISGYENISGAFTDKTALTVGVVVELQNGEEIPVFPSALPNPSADFIIGMDILRNLKFSLCPSENGGFSVELA